MELMKYSFLKVVFIFFLSVKFYLFLSFKSTFEKINFFLFFSLLQINNFLCFQFFYTMISKIILMYFQVKSTLKSNRNHTFKHNWYQTFYTCFLLHINLNYNFYQTLI
jgi:hypothetical protein